MNSESLRGVEKMANAKKCDRCGAFYEISELDNALNNLGKALQGFCNGTSTKNFVDRFDSHFDVCDICLKSFGQWWKDGKHNG